MPENLNCWKFTSCIIRQSKLFLATNRSILIALQLLKQIKWTEQLLSYLFYLVLIVMPQKALFQWIKTLIQN